MIQIDSRKVNKGDIFVAIKGLNFDGHDYADKAEENGAIKVYCERHIAGLAIPQEIVENSRKTAGELSASFHSFPSSSFKLIGITGTNGKTSCTYMAKSILESTGAKVGLIGTNQNMIGDKVIHTEFTTPESVDLQALFAQMRDEGCQYVVMEVSSHALTLERTAGTHFAVGAFTNLTQDHLDFHKDMDDYFEAKCKLFDISEKSVINIDNPWGKKLYERLLVGDAVSGVPHIEGHDPNNVGANYVRPSLKEDIVFPLPPHIVGEFNLENAAIAYNICKTLGLSEEQIIEGFANFKGVNGRMEVVHDGDFKVIIDYAHTPDGLENILKTAREFTKGRLIILFGCGGNRDNKKRPIMGKVCASLADFCIVTSDNPRTENPEKIIEEIVVGMLPCKKTIITSRHDAIKYALENAKKDDCIILAGKGHEDYQIIGKEKIRFNEHEIVREILWKN